MCIVKFSGDVDEAITLANQTKYGLAGLGEKQPTI